jgi:hypothetical protein
MKYLALFLIPSLIWGEVVESISSKKIPFGDQVVYEASSDEPIEFEYPTGISYRPGEDLPLLEVEEVEKNEKYIKLKVRYFDLGIFPIPIRWQLKGVQAGQSDLTIEVVSNLSPDENTPPNPEDPIEFRGPLWRTLLFYTLLISIVAYFGSLIWKIFKLRKDKILDAIIEQPLTLSPSMALHDQIQKVLAMCPVSAKSYAYLLSHYFRSHALDKFGEEVAYLPEPQFFEAIFNSTMVDKNLLNAIQEFMIQSKYKNTEDLVHYPYAFQMFQSIQEIIESWNS